MKSYLSPRGEYDPYLELEHLRVFVAQPAYLLAMKCVAMRLGEELKPRMTLKLPRMTLKLWGADSPLPLPDERTPERIVFRDVRVAAAKGGMAVSR